MNTRKLTLLLGLALALALTGPAADKAVPTTIREVKVESKGPPLPDPAFVFEYISVKKGDEFDRRNVSRDIKTLLESGRFSNVDTHISRSDDGITLTYLVQLRPKLGREVVVVGADEVGASRVREWLTLQVGDPVDNSVLSVRTRNVMEEYRKKYYPRASAKWDLAVDEASGLATVTFRVKEGAKASLNRVYFNGGKAISRRELRKAMSPRVWKPIISWITGEGTYNIDDLESDREMLRRMYQDKGYLDAEVSHPQVMLKSSGKLVAIYSINQGRQYKIGDLSLEGISVFAKTDLLPNLTLKPGDVASLAAINRNAENLRDYYQSRGYIRATATPRIQTHADLPVADIRFVFTEGKLIHLRYVDITGNTRTRDEVIRREILVYPGEVYNQVKAKRSERILQNLGFFSAATSFPMETTDPVRDDIVYEVEEQQTGTFTIGAGYSSIDDIIGFVELSQGNFDLFGWPNFTGGGQKLRLRTQIGTERTDYEMSFVEPWFLGRKLSLGVDLYQHTMGYLSDEYNQRQTGGALTLGKPFPVFFDRVELKYSLDKYDIYDVSTNAPLLILNEEGTTVASKLALTLIYDTRNNVFIPTRGTRFTVGGFFSGGVLGFDAQDYGFKANSATYWPLWFNHVFSLRSWAEVVQEYGSDEDVHLFDRLFLGGAKTLRGYKYRRVGPTDPPTGEPLGGKSGAMVQLEYTVPVVSMIRVATFYDVGNVWANAYDFDLASYCSDMGIGIRIDIPSFPIRIDYAWPLEINGDIYRTNARFNFTLGYDY